MVGAIEQMHGTDMQDRCADVLNDSNADGSFIQVKVSEI